MEKPVPGLVPPFSKHHAIRQRSQQLYPCRFRHDGRLRDPRDDTNTYLETDLRTPRLNKIHRHLWLAGLPRPSRPLHRQLLMRRTLYLTESPDEHLVWHEERIFIKPVPEYLLDYEYWSQELCRYEELYKSACGLLLSYAWLVLYQSDFRIAQQTGIIPDDVDWESWNAFIYDFLGHIDASTMHMFDERYQYGELRLSRLNTIYRFSISTFSLHNFVYGFMSTSTWHAAFFQRNFGWILAVFVYVAVILSAMQVGLATTELSGHSRFQGLSYGVALLSIAVVFAAVGLMFLFWLTLSCYHLVSTIRYLKKKKSEEERHMQP